MWAVLCTNKVNLCSGTVALNSEMTLKKNDLRWGQIGTVIFLYTVYNTKHIILFI